MWLSFAFIGIYRYADDMENVDPEEFVPHCSSSHHRPAQRRWFWVSPI